MSWKKRLSFRYRLWNHQGLRKELQKNNYINSVLHKTEYKRFPILDFPETLRVYHWTRTIYHTSSYHRYNSVHYSILHRVKALRISHIALNFAYPSHSNNNRPYLSPKGKRQLNRSFPRWPLPLQIFSAKTLVLVADYISSLFVANVNSYLIMSMCSLLYVKDRR